MYSVDIYSRVRRACLKDGMSAREAARYFNKDRKTIAKMLRHELPPGYRRSDRRRSERCSAPSKSVSPDVERLGRGKAYRSGQAVPWGRCFKLNFAGKIRCVG